MSRLERAIQYVAPVYATKRERARAQMSALKAAQSYYDGADTGRRGNSIRRLGAAPDTITARSLPRLRTGSHDLVRNNPHAAKGVRVIVAEMIGTGIIPRFKRGKRAAQNLEQYARETLDTPRIDVFGQHDYYGLQALAAGTMVESGEALIIRRRVNDRFLPVRFQVLEPDHLDESMDRLLPDGGRIIQGVEFDSQGRRVQYWILPEHPGGQFLRTRNSVPIPAEDVIHVYRVDRPGQVRGIPWLAPVMLRLADFDDYENAQLVRQKIAACFAAFYHDTGGPERTDTTEKIEPGMIQRLAPGSKVEFGTPPQVTDYADYSRVSLRAIAAGLGISYEALTGDLTSVNFSSGRMGHLQFQRNLDAWRWLTFIPQACVPMMRWWLEAAALTGKRTSDVTVSHTPPRREMISPEREVPANTAAMRSGQTSLVKVLQESGIDPEEHLEEIESTLELLDRLGIVLDSDPRKVSTSGVMQTQPEGGFVDD